MLCIGGADNLLSLDYYTSIHMPRMRVKTFLQKISKIFSGNHPEKPPKFFRKIILRKFP